MSKEQPLNHPPRNQVVLLLGRKFISEFEEAARCYELPQQLELAEHLLDVLELMGKFLDTRDHALLSQYREKEDALLKKYGKTLQPYFDKGFHKYFDFGIVLTEKEIFSTEVFNRLPSEEQSLTTHESVMFITFCHRSLHTKTVFLSLQLNPETALKEPPIALSGPGDTDREFTKSRQLLAVHYLLKAGWSIEPRSSHSISSIARLAHLLTGTRLTNIQNSELYKKFQQMPNFNKDQQLITDLKFIRPYFDELNMITVVQLIDEEIHRAIKESTSPPKKK